MPRRALDKSALLELHSYARLLFLRDGRQYQDKTTYHGLAIDTSSDEPAEDSQSAHNSLLGGLDEESLRREFLDRLSETVSAAKGGRHVVASLMYYWPDQVKVFVSINTGFPLGGKHGEFLNSINSCLRCIAANLEDDAEKHKAELWTIMLQHQVSRLGDIVSELRQTMKDLPQLSPPLSTLESMTDSSPSNVDIAILNFEQCLCLLSEWLFSASSEDIQDYDNLVRFSYVIYRTFTVDRFQSLGRAGEKLRQGVGFLGRLKRCLDVFIAASERIAGFDRLSLIPVPGIKDSKKPAGRDWSLAETFRSLSLQLDDDGVDGLMGSSTSKKKWTKSRLIQEFSKLKSPTWEVHAEMQLIFFVHSHPSEVSNGKRLDYIGCSRYSCLLCTTFLSYHGNLKTRGCHGKLYSHSWTLALGKSLGQSEQKVLSKAVTKLLTWMRTELIAVTIAPPRKTGRMVKESTVGGSLFTRLSTEHHGNDENQLVSRYLLQQRAQNAHRSNEESLSLASDEDATSQITRQQATLTIGNDGWCRTCGDETSRQCSYCQAAVFCSQVCEREMPLSHLLVCNMRQTTSADYLYDDAIQDQIPQDPKVRQDYWFDRCRTIDEESHLLGLFKGILLYNRYNATRENLAQWQSFGDKYLASQLVAEYEQRPPGSGGSYFPWFLKQRNRFDAPANDASNSGTSSHLSHLEDSRNEMRKYLAAEDQNKNVDQLTPSAKRYCLDFLAMVMSNWHPGPVNHDDCHWFHFGFVIFDEEYYERSLGGLYHEMLFGSLQQEKYLRSLGSDDSEVIGGKQKPTCSFNEFWTAWDQGELLALLDKHSPAKHDGFPRLRQFLRSATPRPSIWRLRHFLAIENCSVEFAAPEIGQAARDYGFSEHLDTRTILDLKDFYTKLFGEAEPLEIHSERIKGSLLDFAERRVGGLTLRVKGILEGLTV